MPFAERLGVERRQVAQAQLEAFQRRLRDALLDVRRDRMQRANALELLGAPERIRARLCRQQQPRPATSRAAAEIDTHADRPGQHGQVERQPGGNLVEQRERIVSLAVDLVDEGDDRDVAQPANLEQLAGLALDALRGIDHHHGRVDRAQRAVGILAEVGMARRIEQVEHDPVVLERHDR